MSMTKNILIGNLLVAVIVSVAIIIIYSTYHLVVLLHHVGGFPAIIGAVVALVCVIIGTSLGIVKTRDDEREEKKKAAQDELHYER